ncbi:hypothetical protein ACROYT_G015435 [Oculina patagonica]
MSTDQAVWKIAQAIGVEIKDDIEISHRIKMKHGNKPILAKFCNHKIKSKVYKARTQLRSTTISSIFPDCVSFTTEDNRQPKISINENLTQYRKEMMKTAREKQNNAGDKKRSIQLQHASQMWNLLEAVDPGGDDILCLLKDGGDIVWKAWVKPNLESHEYKPGTIISYLTSYEKFLIFVTHQRFNKEAPPLHADNSKLFDIIKNDLKGWRSTVDSKSHEHKNKRFVEESDGLLTLKELDKIKSSKTYSEEELGLSAVAPIDFHKMKAIDKATLETMMTLCAKGAMARKCLGIDLLQKSSEHVMEMIGFLADNQLKTKLNFYIDKDDVFKRMGVVCKERWQWLKRLGEEEDGPG